MPCLSDLFCHNKFDKWNSACLRLYRTIIWAGTFFINDFTISQRRSKYFRPRCWIGPTLLHPNRPKVLVRFICLWASVPDPWRFDVDPCLWLMDSDPDPTIFVIDLHDTNKKLILSFFSLLLFECTLTSFFKDKKSKRSHKTVGIKVFLAIFLDNRRIQIYSSD